MSEEIKALPSTQLRRDVAEALGNAGAKVRELVVVQLVDDEISKRKTAVLGVLAKIEAKQTELRKAEGEGRENQRFDLDGKPTGAPVYTKPQLEAINKIKETIAKLQSALEDAFEKGDFSKVFSLANNN